MHRAIEKKWIMLRFINFASIIKFILIYYYNVIVINNKIIKY